MDLLFLMLGGIGIGFLAMCYVAISLVALPFRALILAYGEVFSGTQSPVSGVYAEPDQNKHVIPWSAM